MSRPLGRKELKGFSLGSVRLDLAGDPVSVVRVGGRGQSIRPRTLRPDKRGDTRLIVRRTEVSMVVRSEGTSRGSLPKLKRNV